MKLLKYFFYIVLLLCLVFVAVGIFLPAKTTVERSAVIQAPPATVYELVSDFNEVSRWSPWFKGHTELNTEVSQPASGIGAVMTTRSDEAEAEIRREEIISAEPHSRVKTRITLGNALTAESTYELEREGQATEVTWRLHASHGLNLFQRYAGLLLEQNIGETFEEGLNDLKKLAESLPTIRTREITYRAAGTVLTGYLAMPRHADDEPGVLVVHEWWGHTDYVRKRAEMLAELGYVAFALDMYGDGKKAEHPEDAKKFMMEVVNNQEVAQARFDAALAILKSQPEVDPQRIAAIGYCFGGAVVLNMARAGADLEGVVSFHGALGNLAPVSDDVEADFLVLHGAADPMVTEEQEKAFKESMDEADVDYEFVAYEGVKHAFTNPEATAKGEKFGLPLEYDAEADADSWQRMKEFLDDIFN